MELTRFLAVHLKNKEVRGDMGLGSRLDRAKLKWWHKLCNMKGDRYVRTCTCIYPRQLFDQV